jgi:hypothetical protein
VRLEPGLRAHRGKLFTGEGPGVAVHAGSFLRKREIVLDAGLLASPGELARILLHEIYHFVWLRLGNAARLSYEALLVEEIKQGARGELGWSAELRKQPLSAHDWRRRTRRWREYVSESFSDTAAWLYSGSGAHDEFTLPPVWRRRRRQWFRHSEALRRISV